MSSNGDRTRDQMRHLRTVLWGAGALMAARLLLVAAVLPYWQNPDEPSHFAVIRAMAAPDGEAGSPDEAAILTSMAEHGWWAAYGAPLQQPLPVRFEDVDIGHVSRAQFGEPALYYRLAAWFLAVSERRSVEQQYVAMRLISATLTLSAWAMVALGTVSWFGPVAGAWAALLLASVPQFALIGVSVSPDPFVVAAGAFIWWQAGWVRRSRRPLLVAMLVGAVAVMAVLAKRLAMPLAPQAGALLVVGLWRSGAGWWWARIGAGLGGCVILAVTAVSWFGRPDEWARLYDWYEWMVLRPRAPVTPPGYFREFTAALLASAYAAAGWQRFFAPAPVYAIAALAFGVTFVAGAWALAVRRAQWRGALAAGIILTIQLAAIYGTRVYEPGGGAQGRFLFPAAGSIIGVCALGAAQLTTNVAPRGAATLLAAALVICDLTALVWVLVLPYLT